MKLFKKISLIAALLLFTASSNVFANSWYEIKFDDSGPAKFTADLPELWLMAEDSSTFFTAKGLYGASDCNAVYAIIEFTSPDDQRMKSNIIHSAIVTGGSILIKGNCLAGGSYAPGQVNIASSRVVLKIK